MRLSWWRVATAALVCCAAASGAEYLVYAGTYTRGGSPGLDGSLAALWFAGEFRHIVIGVELRVVVDLRHLAGAPLARSPPRLRAVNRLAVHLQPGADLEQTLFHDHRNASVCGGTDVQHQVAAAAHDIRQENHQPPAARV